MILWGSLAGGVVGTIILTSGLRLSQELGWTRMDLPLLLGTVFSDESPRFINDDGDDSWPHVRERNRRGAD